MMSSRRKPTSSRTTVARTTTESSHAPTRRPRSGSALVERLPWLIPSTPDCGPPLGFAAPGRPGTLDDRTHQRGELGADDRAVDRGASDPHHLRDLGHVCSGQQRHRTVELGQELVGGWIRMPSSAGAHQIREQGLDSRHRRHDRGRRSPVALVVRRGTQHDPTVSVDHKLIGHDLTTAECIGVRLRPPRHLRQEARPDLEDLRGCEPREPDQTGQSHTAGRRRIGRPPLVSIDEVGRRPRPRERTARLQARYSGPSSHAPGATRSTRSSPVTRSCADARPSQAECHAVLARLAEVTGSLWSTT